MAQQSRRRFLTTSVLAAGAGGAACLAQEGSSASEPQYFEWRTYRLASDGQRARVLNYLQSAALPAWKRMGVGPVGVFTEVGESPSLDVHVLLTFNDAASAVAERAQLEADANCQQAAEAYLAAAKDDPAFREIDSHLMVAFAGQPQLAKPVERPGVLELRTYHSHSEAKARRKIEMFNDGEMPIFREAGFDTVFFGESLIGAGLPHLKYLLASKDMAANNASWGAFVNHPNWKAMKDLPKYADTVSRITKLYLTPAEFSEV